VALNFQTGDNPMWLNFWQWQFLEHSHFIIYCLLQVALNFQTGDNPMWLNFWRFRENANMGYVLKPPYMRGKFFFIF